MKALPYLLTCCALVLLTSPALAVSGDPPDATHPYAVHDPNRPVPTVVTPGTSSTPDMPGKAPSDAIVLFNGTDAFEWVADKEGDSFKWAVKDGSLQSVPKTGDIRTKREFGDCQLHIEWATPLKLRGDSQSRGNSGVFLMGIYEIQVLDSFNNWTYPDGQAGAIYGQHPPLVNTSRGPGEWQTFDIIFHPPLFNGDKVAEPATIIVFQNGVLVQDHWLIEGFPVHLTRAAYSPHPAKLPLKLQEHGNTVQFRNIWIREIPRPGADGLEGPNASREAVAKKRAELARKSLAEAKKLIEEKKTFDGLMCHMDVIKYQMSQEAVEAIEKYNAEYLARLGNLDQAALEAEKGNLQQLLNAYNTLERYKILGKDFAPRQATETFVKAKGIKLKLK